MADSIERIAGEVATYQAPPNGQYIQVHPRVMRDWESRLRALSPAGGDWAASGFIRVGLTNVLVSDELSDFVGRKEVSREVHSMIHEDTRNDPHEFGAGIEDNPKAKYWQQRAAFWRETAKALGYVPPGEAIAASPQQEPGAKAKPTYRDLIDYVTADALKDGRGVMRIDPAAMLTPQADPMNREVIAYTYGDEIILARFWTGESAPEGWTPLYR